jgi:hypothetical protein
MVGSGDTASAGVPRADSRRDRPPFCTLQASKDQVGVSLAVIRGTHQRTGDLSARRTGDHKSYIAAELSRELSRELSQRLSPELSR